MQETTFKQQILEECKNKQNIFIFVSKQDEIDTKTIIKELLKLGKTIIVPICNPNNELELSKINDLNDLTSSTYGILEPKEKIPFTKENIDIFFVPGTKFDCNGNRKGRGKGFFDRFLKDIKGKKPIIGLCYEDQITKSLISKEWDIKVDKIIKDKK